MHGSIPIPMPIGIGIGMIPIPIVWSRRGNALLAGAQSRARHVEPMMLTGAGGNSEELVSLFPPPSLPAGADYLWPAGGWCVDWGAGRRWGVEWASVA